MRVQTFLSMSTPQTDTMDLEPSSPCYLGDQTLPVTLPSLLREVSRRSPRDSCFPSGSDTPAIVPYTFSFVTLTTGEEVKDTPILSGFREEEPNDHTLVETLDKLVPLLHEVGDSIPLVTFLSNSVILPPLATDLSKQTRGRNWGEWF